jgi:hypothetical protein
MAAPTPTARADEDMPEPLLHPELRTEAIDTPDLGPSNLTAMSYMTPVGHRE